MKSKGGRPALFAPKDSGYVPRIAALTKAGARLFEQARKRLGVLAKSVGFTGRISDSDTVEFLARGDAESAAYLAKRFRESSNGE